jgi:hypothetical protein
LPITNHKRQLLLSVKSGQSNSWFIYEKKIIWKYNLPEIYLLLEAPYTKAEWKKLTYEKVYQYWKNHITSLSEYYTYLKYLNVEAFKPGKQHPLIFLPTMSARDTDRIPMKLKLVSGSYIFQSNRSKFNQSQIHATCLLCGEEDEDLEFFFAQMSTT